MFTTHQYKKAGMDKGREKLNRLKASLDLDDTTTRDRNTLYSLNLHRRYQAHSSRKSLLLEQKATVGPKTNTTKTTKTTITQRPSSSSVLLRTTSASSISSGGSGSGSGSGRTLSGHTGGSSNSSLVRYGKLARRSTSASSSSSGAAEAAQAARAAQAAQAAQAAEAASSRGASLARGAVRPRDVWKRQHLHSPITTPTSGGFFGGLATGRYGEEEEEESSSDEGSPPPPPSVVVPVRTSSAALGSESRSEGDGRRN